MKIIIVVIFSITLLTSIVGSQQLCNGYAELCSKSFSDVAYATTHNAYANGTSIAANQDYDIQTQLKDGIRGLMLDAHFPANSTTQVELCHQTCQLLDSGPAKTTLALISNWLDNNPNEVITVFWENADKVSAAGFNDLYNQSGFIKHAYYQVAGQPWPTLSQLIAGGKRAVNFVDTGADPSVQWLMPEYDYVFETPYDNQNLSSFPCTVDRPKDQPRPMYVLNHFLYSTLSAGLTGSTSVELPDPSMANVSNGASLADHAKRCTQTFNKTPNYLAVDFYEKGSGGQDVFSITASINGVTYIPKQLGDGTTTTNGTSGTNNANGASKTNAAKPNNELRDANINILVGLVVVGTLVMFVL